MVKSVPDISVIVPSHNRRVQLLETLQAIADQELTAASFDVVVVLDSVTDGSADAVTAEEWPVPLKTVEVSERSAAATRNAGAAAARGKLLVFVDDDIVVEPGFLQAHRDACATGEKTVSIGCSVPSPGGDGYFPDAISTWWNWRFDQMSLPYYRFGFTDLMSGNFAVSADFFDKVSGFDASLRCREDYELGYRLLKEGAAFQFTPAARGLHVDATDFDKSLGRAEAEATADIEIAQKHPELADALPISKLGKPDVAGRIARAILFSAPWFGNAAAHVAKGAMAMTERMGLRGVWGLLHNAVGRHAYHSAVAASLGSLADLKRLYERGQDALSRLPVATVELGAGQTRIDQQLEETSAAGATVSAAGVAVGTIVAEPGKEPLRARHLTAFLSDYCADWFAPLEAAKLLESVEIELIPGGSKRVGELDLATGKLAGDLTQLQWVLVRSGDRMLGNINVPANTDGPAVKRLLLEDRNLASRIYAASVVPTLLPESTQAVSVVICTRDRAKTLKRCLTAVERLNPAPAEVIVVDNAPSTPETADLVKDMSFVRYVREDTPGLDWARNKGIAEAKSDLIAFTDDDTCPDRGWIGAISRAIEAPDVSAMTGLVAPMDMSAEAQRYFEMTYGGMGKGYEPRRFDRDEIGNFGLLWSSAAGVGANMAFRRSVFENVGRFDPALDVGTDTRGGGDIEMFHRIMAGGHILRYEPDAMVWHEHRSDMETLEGQLRDNGSGFVAYLLAAARNRTVPRLAIIWFALRHWGWSWLVRRLIWPNGHKRAFVLAEIKGALSGPGRYRRALETAEQLASPTQEREHDVTQT